MKRKSLAVVFLLLLMQLMPLQAAKLRSVQSRHEGGKTSLSFVLDAPVEHKVFTLSKPDRVVVDFENTELAFNLQQMRLNHKLIKAVRSGHPKAHTLRLVFELTDAVTLKEGVWNRNASRAHDFSFDLLARAFVTHQSNSEKISNTKLSNATQKTSPKKLRDVVVVIDPGHGGKDPGASGPRKSQEKNITLAIALKLKRIIDEQPGMKAVLTRKGDYYVGLRERLKIARQYDGDIFVSIHADAFINKLSNGASVFALSQRGATSEAARWLAEKENYSELGGVNLEDLDDESGLVREVLIDLSQTATISSSVRMGDEVLKNLDTITRLHNEKVEQARFMVLKSPDIPSILIETGFITNPQEESRLTSYAYQTRMTQAIFQGIKNYFWEYPPHGSRIEAMAGNSLYVAKK